MLFTSLFACNFSLHMTAAAAVDVSSVFFCFSSLVSVYGKDKYFAYFVLVGTLSLFLLLSISLKIRSSRAGFCSKFVNMLKCLF